MCENWVDLNLGVWKFTEFVCGVFGYWGSVGFWSQGPLGVPGFLIRILGNLGPGEVRGPGTNAFGVWGVRDPDFDFGDVGRGEVRGGRDLALGDWRSLCFATVPGFPIVLTTHSGAEPESTVGRSQRPMLMNRSCCCHCCGHGDEQLAGASDGAMPECEWGIRCCLSLRPPSASGVSVSQRTAPGGGMS